MTTRADVVCCMIWRDDPLLEEAVASVEPFVRLVHVVVDDDAPEESFERLRAIQDVHRRERGALGLVTFGWTRRPWVDDFSATRNASFDLTPISGMRRAPPRFLLWLDSDDRLVGGENLTREVARIPEGGRLLCPYDYEHDPVTGECTRQQWRERVVGNHDTWHWEHPTHETLAKDGGYDPGLDVWAEGVRVVHQRKEKGQRGRSLAILEKWHAAGHDDAWTNLNLGLELHNVGRFKEALEHYSRHFDLSGWAQEKAMSAMRAAECVIGLNLMHPTAATFQLAYQYVDLANELCPGEFEPLFAEAKLLNLRATFCPVEGDMGRVVASCFAAIDTPETRTPLGRNPRERAFDVYELLRNACEAEERWHEALAATEAILAYRPGSPPHLLAKRRYETQIMLRKFEKPVEAKDPIIGIPVSRGDRLQIDAEPCDDNSGVRRAGGATGNGTTDDTAAIQSAIDAELSLSEDGVPDKSRLLSELSKANEYEYSESADGAELHVTLSPGESFKIPEDIKPWTQISITMRDAVKKVPQQPGVTVTRVIAGAGGKSSPSYDVTILCGPASDPWNPEIVEQYGAGGSETAVVEMAKRLANRGHRVVVYNRPGQEGIYSGVEYLHWTQEVRPKCDVLVAWRVAPFLMQAEANVRVLWCHDTEALGLTYGLSLLADKVFALSQWHKGNLVEKHNLPESQVYVTRNGVNPEMWRSRIANARNAHRAIYCSSPDRGLSALLDMWPAIRRQVTDAELAIFYSWANWQRQADERGNEIHRGFIASMVNRIAELKDSGVRIEGLVSKAKLAHEMRTSGVFAYPAWFSETSCCNVMEARAAGMRIVTTPVAALKETALGEVLVEGDWTSESFRSRFAEKVVGAMLDESVDDRAARSRKAVEELDWARVAEDWERLFGELLAGAERGAMPAFKEAV